MDQRTLRRILCMPSPCPLSAPVAMAFVALCQKKRLVSIGRWEGAVFRFFFVIFCVGLLAAPRDRQRRCHAAFAAWTWAERKKRSAPTAAIETGSDDQKKIV
ncbi:hypothetical protein [Pandoravirus japonicus]|uniref:Uncharacterized protein n=1 Tax=Pandoravirus japonicus TaxID=2823154 RepID=A0A811BRJ4_9VIRU|nr:hypothetical protein [Pandoravirus japonicus]